MVGKPEGARLQGCSGRRWEESIKLHLEEVGWETTNSICMADVREMAGFC
jgi:hypothetical protein